MRSLVNSYSVERTEPKGLFSMFEVLVVYKRYLHPELRIRSE